jgi:hypothetical protein
MTALLRSPHAPARFLSALALLLAVGARPSVADAQGDQAPFPTSPWVGSAVHALVIPVSRGRAAYDVATVEAFMTTGWPELVAAGSHGRATLDVTVTQWLDAAHGRHLDVDPQQILTSAAAFIDLAKFADESGVIRAVVVVVPGRPLAPEVMPLEFKTTTASGRTVEVRSVVVVGAPEKDGVAMGPERMAGLTAVLGVLREPLLVDTSGAVLLSPEARARLGWTGISLVHRTQPATLETASAPATSRSFKAPLFGTDVGGWLYVESLAPGRLVITRVGAQKSGSPYRPLESITTESARPGELGVPLGFVADTDRRVVIAWERNTAILQFNLSSTGVDMQRSREKEKNATP